MLKIVNDQQEIKKKRKYNLTVSFGVIALIIFGITCIRPVKEIGFEGGVFPFIIDGTIQHKVGELLLWIPLFLIGLSTFQNSNKKTLVIIERSKLWMIAGGVLNLIAWFSLYDKVAWHLWCIVVFLWGIFAVPLSKKWFLSDTKKEESSIQKTVDS